MKILVTGAAGFIGSHVAEAFISDGHDVVCIDDFSAGKRTSVYGVEVHKCDITTPDVGEYVEGCDVVCHQAASKKNICLNNPHRDLEVNGGGTLNLLQYSKQYNVKKFIHASTGSVYGEPLIMPQKENHPLNPNSYYGVSKLAGERYVNMFGLDCCILRYFHVYGPGQDDSNLGGVVAVFIKNAKDGEPLVIFGDGRQIRCFTHVDDIVEINRLALSLSGVFNCASDARVSINQLATMVQLTSKNGVEVLYEPALEGDIRYFDVDSSKLKSMGFRFKYNDFSEGLKQTHEQSL